MTQDEYRSENDLLRERFKKVFPDVSKIKLSDIYALIWFLESELELHAEKGLLCMNMIPLDMFSARMIREKGIGYKGLALRVRAHYFECGREAVTFRKDGWVGFCGWAGGCNFKPFQKGFSSWLDTYEDFQKVISGQRPWVLMADAPRESGL